MIKFIISVCIIIFLGIYSIFSAAICFFISDKEKLDDYYKNVVIFVFNLVLKVGGIKTHVSGIENLRALDNEKSIFIISNHRGYFDILTGYTVIRRKCGIVAKDSLGKIPVLGYWMKKIHCLFLDRSNLRSGAMMVVDAINLMNKGISVWVFPEGTRNKSDDPTELLPFKAGVFKIPEKTDAYILPMAIINSENAFEKHLPRVKSTDIYINIGKAYKLSDLNTIDRQNIDEYSRGVMKDLIVGLKEKAR